MAYRDPWNRAIGSNHPCWCGSGKKFKKCHKDREEAKAKHPLQVSSVARKHLEKSIACICQSDSKNCSTAFGKNHTIPKSKCLDYLAENNHVTGISFEPRKDDGQNETTTQPIYERVSTGRASVFKSFCSVHDSRLFRKQDLLLTENLNEFLVEGYYRTSSMERFRKINAIGYYGEIRSMDSGTSIENQVRWQTLLSKDIAFQKLALEMGQAMHARLERSVVLHSDFPLKFLHIETCQSLPIAGIGCFQPSRDMNGAYLQTVNAAMWDGVNLRKEALDTVFVYCLPHAGGSLLGLACDEQDNKALQFIQSLEPSNPKFVNTFSNMLIAHVENVYFRTSYIEQNPEIAKEILTIAELGVGIDLSSNDIARIRNSSLFPVTEIRITQNLQ